MVNLLVIYHTDIFSDLLTIIDWITKEKLYKQVDVSYYLGNQFFIPNIVIQSEIISDLE